MKHLYVRREGSGPPLVLIHGVAGSGAIWEPMVEPLAKYFDVIRIDLLGYGYSPKPNAAYDVKTHIEAIHATLEQLNISRPYAIAGLSMGAMLAIEYAAAYPREVSRIVCIGLPYYRSPEEARLKLKDSFFSKLTIEHPFWARIVAATVWPVARNSRWLRSRLGLKAYTDQMSKESAMATYQSFSKTLNNVMINHRIDTALAKLGYIPTLFIHGVHDQWTTPSVIKGLAGQLEAGEYAEIPGTLHNVVIYAPEQTASAVIKFLK